MLLLAMPGRAIGQVSQPNFEAVERQHKDWLKEMTQDTVFLQCRGLLKDWNQGYPESKSTENSEIFDVEFNEVKAPGVLKVGLSTMHFNKHRPIKCSFSQQNISCVSDVRNSTKTEERPDWARALRPFNTETQSQYTLDINRNTGTLVYQGSLRETQVEGPTWQWTLSEQGTFDCQRAQERKF